MTPAPGNQGPAGNQSSGNKSLENGARESEALRDANPSAESRIRDLLADHALGELSPAEVQTMNALLAEHPELASGEIDALEGAAALLAVSASAAAAESAVPEGLRENLILDAEAFFSGPAPSAAGSATAPVPASFASGVSPGLSFIGGGLATAAVIALLLVLWPSPSRLPLGDRPSPDESFALYEQNTPGVAEHTWTTFADGYESVVGRVAWSDQAQAGYMVLENLPANDPAENQYQLWIVDPARDEFPVDGGVFDVADDGRAYIPIDAKLPVQQPAAFAITLEKPGGVVKSNNPLLVVATAAAPSS